MLIPVVLAGGAGSRLWPASRQSRPKQFLSLIGDDSLIEQTLARLKGIDDIGAPLLVGNEAHRFVLAEQMRTAGYTGRILLEFEPRNTAAAAAAAAFEAVAQYGEEAELLVLPTDHAVANAAAFVEAVATVRQALPSDGLALFGVVPDRPEPGYGYIQAGAQDPSGLRSVKSFREKPDQATAAGYLAAGDYFWNSGIFYFKAGAYLALLSEYAPDIHAAVAAAHAQATVDIDFLRLDAEAFGQARADSIDYAVIEKTNRASMVAFDAGWQDLGSWSSVARAAGVDPRGNSVHGDAWLADADDCVIHSEGRLIAALGTRDQIIVETADAVLVADRTREQEIKQLVTDMAAAGRAEATEHRKAYRPWGSYQQIAAGPRFQVKHIRVTPGGRLSLQSHHHRAEHWIVVRGTAKVTCDDREMLLTENQSTYIPLGAVHRLENPGKVELDLIEVQSGSYLGEDDIVRYDDVYGRAGDADDANTDVAEQS